MVDAARQMLDELMGRNRNLHPSEAGRKINWDDPDYCQYHIVKFCPHDLFINTRADLGPCQRIHDDEAKSLYEKARPTTRKRQYEDEFLRFCSTMLNDVDRKIQKGKQRLQLMHRDQQPNLNSQQAKYQEQLNNTNARINKLLSEAEEAGIRGDVDQAKDLMALCEQLKEEKDVMVTQYENLTNNRDAAAAAAAAAMAAATAAVSAATGVSTVAISPKQTMSTEEQKAIENSPKADDENSNIATSPATTATTISAGATAASTSTTTTTSTNATTAAGTTNGNKKLPPWMSDLGSIPEKQMEVCEICGAFLIVGDAQQRIEDHLMGKQHLGYSRLRKAVDEIHSRRQKDREEEEQKRSEERASRSSSTRTDYRRRDDQRDRRDRGHDRDRERERERDRQRERDRDRDIRNRRDRHSEDRYRHHHHKSHRRRSNSRNSRRNGRTHTRSRSRH